MRGGHYNPDYWIPSKDTRDPNIESYIAVWLRPDPDGRYKNLNEHMISILHEYPRTVMGSTRNEYELLSEEDFKKLHHKLHSLVSRSGHFNPETIDNATEKFLSIYNVKFRAERQRGLFGGAYGRELILSEPLGLSYIHYRKPKANGNNVVLLRNGKVLSEYYISVPFDEVHKELRRVLFSQSRRRTRTRSPKARSPSKSKSR